jgi:hypothetical protein
MDIMCGTKVGNKAVNYENSVSEQQKSSSTEKVSQVV